MRPVLSNSKYHCSPVHWYVNLSTMTCVHVTKSMLLLFIYHKYLLRVNINFHNRYSFKNIIHTIKAPINSMSSYASGKSCTYIYRCIIRKVKKSDLPVASFELTSMRGGPLFWLGALWTFYHGSSYISITAVTSKN